MEWEKIEGRPGVGISLFLLEREGRSIPGKLWEPLEPASGPVILIGHGGSSSVEEDHVGSLARGLVRRHGATCVAIDGPVHGRRRGDRSQDPTLVMLDFSQAWSLDDSMTDEMVADWITTLNVIVQEKNVGDRPVGYWGLSMGTILGLPLVAAEPRITAAVLGLAGIIGPSKDRLARDAERVHCPTLLLMQWDDELFSRESCLALFDALGSDDKQLHITPGSHSAVTTETFLMTASFLAARLLHED